MGINGALTGSYSTYIRNYNSNSGKGRLPAYIERRNQARSIEQTQQNNTQVAISKSSASTSNVQSQAVLLSGQTANLEFTSELTYQKKNGQNRSNSISSSYKLAPQTNNEELLSDEDVQPENLEPNTKQHSSKTEQSPTSIAGREKELTQSELKEVEHLEDRDNEVRVHENQHKAAGGSYAQSPSYSYTTGPDGKQYITDGSVSISLSEESTPSATIKKMEQVHRAALAPAEPSGADRNVAAEAVQIANRARQQLLHESLNTTTDDESQTESSSKVEGASDQDYTKQTPNDSGANSISSQTENTNNRSNTTLSFNNASRVISSHYNSSYRYSTAGSSINTLG